jgi:hypothetical protein
MIVPVSSMIPSVSRPHSNPQDREVPHTLRCTMRLSSAASIFSPTKQQTGVTAQRRFDANELAGHSPYLRRVASRDNSSQESIRRAWHPDAHPGVNAARLCGKHTAERRRSVVFCNGPAVWLCQRLWMGNTGASIVGAGSPRTICRYFVMQPLEIVQVCRIQECLRVSTQIRRELARALPIMPDTVIRGQKLPELEALKRLALAGVALH